MWELQPERKLKPEGRTELGLAAASGNLDVFEVDMFFELPLHIAASFGHHDICQLCLTYSSNLEGIDHENFEGCTPLGCALLFGHTEVASLLIKNGANACYSSKKTGNTPLHHAAWYGSLESVEYLLNANLADANAKNNFGCTPFDMAPPGPVRSLLHKHMRHLGACQ
ncbi:ankyrin-repeat protein [Dunaliella salina]|uniref:Ankyrin-repeat protein n=1 Tax=Dunaliella salina TaxID=3046 RepID=A0ABQ7GQF0_DUNSA|nr:ankyrin-repeat protein [Dunaliella salina]|eukprot:KAF5836834.1 ankyrin-repeat protein [Dunaliella salina]